MMLNNMPDMSGLETLAAIRALPGSGLIVTPGVRPAGGDPGDQRRVETPATAIAAGADRLQSATKAIQALYCGTRVFIDAGGHRSSVSSAGENGTSEKKAETRQRDSSAQPMTIASPSKVCSHFRP